MSDYNSSQVNRIESCWIKIEPEEPETNEDFELQHLSTKIKIKDENDGTVEENDSSGEKNIDNYSTTPNLLNGNAIKNKSFPCSICHKTFTRRTNLNTHERIHRGEEPFKCNVCKKIFRHQSSLKRHISSHVGETPLSNNIYSKALTQQNVREESDIEDKPFAHNFCDSLENPSERPFKCEICDKTFVKKCNLTNHGRSHIGERSFTCNICNKTFPQQIHLNIHERIHTGERPFKCSTCDKSYIQHGHLIRHERVHTGERPYACNLCDKTFTRHNFLTDHERKHTGERPITCNICDKTFSTMNNLNRHKKKIHTDEILP